MTDDDLSMFHAWLHRPHVAAWWGDEAVHLGWDEVRAEYSPRVMVADRVTPYIAMLEGEPVGYAQSYVVLGCGGGWWEGETDPGARGIDQFVSEEAALGKGLGTRLVIALIELLLSDPQVTKIQTDPDPANLRAIRCYEKAGFKAVRTIVTPDGPALFMVRERPQTKRRQAACRDTNLARQTQPPTSNRCS